MKILKSAKPSAIRRGTMKTAKPGMTKSFFIALAVAFLALACLAETTNAQEEKNSSSLASGSSNIPAEQAHFTPQQLDSYYLCYKKPAVRYLRQVFDAYLKGAGDKEKEFDVLSKFSKDYYQSKFIVCSLDPALFGGSLITIMFQGRPDKVFQAWVYERGGKHGEILRGLDPVKFSDEDIRRLKIRYRQFLEDKTHAM